METQKLFIPDDIKINGRWKGDYELILNPYAICFLHKLHEHFESKRAKLMTERMLTQLKLNEGWKPDFPKETENIRKREWTVDPLPKDLLDRRVEITGPVDRKMVINALNSGAKVFMADFEDSNSPSWENVMDGQKNLSDAIEGSISYTNPSNNKHYELNENVATLMVRPRGLHMLEEHILIDGRPMSASLVDFGLYFINNAKQLLANGSGPYFYLPKIEHYLEARWWNEVFEFSQNYLGIPQSSIKATVLIETILASFQLDEILFELRHHSAGLNCGRWDYIFSFIKRFHQQEGYVFPDRDQVTMTVPFMKAYSDLVVKVCHKRNVHAMGGMAAQIPIKNNPEANQIAIDKVRADKLREVKNGHDGTWVAHPALVGVALEVFNEFMPLNNQLDNLREDVEVNAVDLIAVPTGGISEGGVRKNINIGIQYLAAWLSGNGAAAIFNLMEDAATAEISRTQVWQWLKQGANLEDGRTLTPELYNKFFNEELRIINDEDLLNPNWKPHLVQAAQLFNALVLDKELKEFLTVEAYEYIK